MALILADRVKESTTTTGTSDFALGGAITGFQTFAAAVGANNTTYYAIADGADWEVGLGTLSSDGLTLARTTVLQSSNSDTKVSFASGTKHLFVTYPADKAVSDITSTDASIVVSRTGSIIDLAVSEASPASTLLAAVRNTTGATLTKGTAVYISGATGQRSTVSKALATGDATSAQTLGLITSDLSNNSNGYVTVIGLISNINTSAYTDGAQLYLSPTTAGTLTATKPYAPNHLVYVAIVEHAHATQGKLFVKVQNGYEMDELHNVSAQSPTTGQTLVYNASTSLWEKNTVSLTAGVNGTLPVANGGTGITSLGSGVATFLGTPSSANLLAAVTDETGTGALVFANTPTLIAPALGTPTALVGTNITGTATNFTASNVTTNANLTGMVTSVGNATTVVTNANLTGAVTSSGNATSLGSFTSAQLLAALTDETGTGANVFATSPTLVTPALGTPSALVGTNITGTAANFNINGTVGATTPSTGNFTTLTENSVAVVTQSDIGSAPNEIPLNQYLGSLAYQNGDAYYNTGMTVGYRNRIFNGAMMIDQRNAGAAITPSTINTGTYFLDRWNFYNTVASKLTYQQSNSVFPSGFAQSMAISVASAYSPTGSDAFSIEQPIEAFNVSDLNWGTSNAIAITLSFWVRSSLTGTFSGSLKNTSSNRSYPFTFAINSANTWEYKTITVSGDTTGSWVSGTNGVGIRLVFDTGCSANRSTANSWQSANINGVTGTVQLVANAGANFYITGVQLEKGNIATSFDVRSIGTELGFCQRYYSKLTGSNGNYPAFGSGRVTSSSNADIYIKFTTTMRSAPTIAAFNTAIDTTAFVGTTTISAQYVGTDSALCSFTASGLTAGQGATLIGNGTPTAFISLSAEL